MDASNGLQIQPEEEREGDCIDTTDYFFDKIGEAVPLKLENFKFDLQNPPSQPLAVSQRLELLFVAHSEGFYVARTKEIVSAAKALKENGSGSSLQELSVIDVPLALVNILALSADSSNLAASSGGQIHIFLVSSLLDKDQQPSFSTSFPESTVKDLRWTKKLENTYIVLSSRGKLYHGSASGALKEVMENVDAVEWSPKGKHVAVARNNVLSIVSSKKFTERLNILLSFKSWSGFSDPDCTIKVDSIRWVHRDCMILGFFQLTAEGNEEKYLVQVITSKDGKITDASYVPVVLSFSDLFPGLIDDILPSGSGPYLFLSYLEQCELAIAANKKNTDQHIVLFSWSFDDEGHEAKVIDINRDNWIPRIELQEDGDDNLILGLCLGKAEPHEKVKIQLGVEEQRELSPYCVLFCLTLEGKIVMFHIAGPTGTPVPPQVASDEEDTVAELAVPSLQSLESKEHSKQRANELAILAPRTPSEFDADQISQKEVIVTATQEMEPQEADGSTDGRRQASIYGQQSTNNSFLDTSEGRDFSKKQNKELEGIGSNADFTARNIPTDKSIHTDSQGSRKPVETGKELPRIPKNTLSQSLSDGKVLFSKNMEEKSSSLNSSFGGESSYGSSIYAKEAFVPSAPPFSCVRIAQHERQRTSSLQSLESKDHSKERTNELPVGNSISSSEFSADQISQKEAIVTVAQEMKPQEANQSTDGRQQTSNYGQQSTNNSFLDTSKGRDFSKIQNKELEGIGSSADSIARNIPTDKSIHTNIQGSRKPVETDKELPWFTKNTLPQSLLDGKVLFSKNLEEKSSSLSSTFSGKSSDGSSIYSKDASVPSAPPFSFGRMAQHEKQRTSVLQSSSQENFVLRNSSSQHKVHPTRGNRVSSPLSGLPNSEPNISKQFANVDEMTKELDTLLRCIEEEGGFRDACIALHRDSVVAVEQGIETSAESCGKWRTIMDERNKEIKNLLDKTVQVLARKEHMEGIVKQASDSYYWDLWDRTKLSSEPELKRRRILELNQDLTSQLVELERHFNSLELNMFGENAGVHMGRAAVKCRGRPGNNRSLHSLYNTVSSQLSAAEQLSECLSKQMAALRIKSPVKKQNNAKMELFEAIGLTHGDAPFRSPGPLKATHTMSIKKHLESSSSAGNINQSRRNIISSAVKSDEPETARRRRDSLDRSWASFEPPKTTVKRILLEERQNVNSNVLPSPVDNLHFGKQMVDASITIQPKHHTTPLTNSYLTKSSGIVDKSSKQASESPSTILFGWANKDLPLSPSTSAGLKSPAMQVTPIANISKSYSLPVSQSSPIIAQSSAREMDNLSPVRKSTFDKSDSLSMKTAKSSSQNLGTYMHQTPSMVALSSGKTNDTSNLHNKQTTLTKLASESFVKHIPSTESSSLNSGKSQTHTVPKKTFQFNNAATPIKSEGGEKLSAPAFSIAYPAPLLEPSSILPSDTPSLSPNTQLFTASVSCTESTLNTDNKTFLTPSSAPLSLGASVNSNKPTGSAASLIPFPPSLSLSSSSPIVGIPSHPMKSEAQTRKVEPQPSKDVNSAAESLVPEPEPEPEPEHPVNLNLNVEPSTSSASAIQGREATFNNLESSAFNAKESNTQITEQQYPSKNEISDSGVSQEDEMEEEAPETSDSMSVLNLGSLGGFALESASSTAPKANPFGGPFATSGTPSTGSSVFTMTAPSRELFRPASFDFQSPQPSSQHPSQPASLGFNMGQASAGPGIGFGQPAQVGVGQQALGSVLGSFGQSRQIGMGLPGSSFASGSSFSAATGGGFVNTATGGGFANIGSGGGGFASLASGVGAFAGAGSGGGLPALATGGGFSSIGPGGGGFASLASGGGAFAGAGSGGGLSGPGGGFGAFNNQQASGASIGFSSFGIGAGGTVRPPSELFTQIRK